MIPCATTRGRGRGQRIRETEIIAHRDIVHGCGRNSESNGRAREQNANREQCTGGKKEWFFALKGDPGIDRRVTEICHSWNRGRLLRIFFQLHRVPDILVDSTRIICWFQFERNFCRGQNMFFALKGDRGRFLRIFFQLHRVADILVDILANSTRIDYWYQFERNFHRGKKSGFSR